MDKCMYQNDSCLDCPEVADCLDKLQQRKNRKRKPIPQDRKGFVYLMVIYLIVFAADVISTFMNKGIWQHLEANLLYKYAGISAVIALNIAYILGFFYFYNRKKAKPTTRFIVLFLMISIIITRIIVVTHNFLVFLNPPTIEVAMAVTQAQKTATIVKLEMLNIIPFFNGLVCWLFFKVDHYIFRKPKRNHNEPSKNAQV